MRVLIVTDAFPPVCGGSGWSTYELARGLRARGHVVTIVRPRVGTDLSDVDAAPETPYDGFEPVGFHRWAPRVPFVRNYFKNERLYVALAAFLASIVRERQIDVVHAQHLMSGPASVDAARACGVPVVCTVRDYWPVCYWSDLIHDRDADTLCPGCTASRMTQCLRPHAGPLWPLALPAIPYMRRNLALKRRRLSEADAVIAVSGAMARDLRARATELAATRIEIVHNPVDVAGLRALAAQTTAPMAGAYALYVGKLEPNKGVGHLLAAARRAALPWPLVLVGDGSQRAALQAEAASHGQVVHVAGWCGKAEVLAWLQHASLLVFPSHGPESLSRVLIEASTLGVPIAAMDTGGTSDIVVHEQTGLLSRTADELGVHMARLVADRPLASSLGQAAMRRVEARFDADVVLAQVERVYHDVGAATRGDDAG